ncbi:hypothetical protein HDK90DRAFT_488567 [Phyllosticta capitalensis]|uniref:Secreted protein n=1 Tax=Phyllosticta capitalensis TaxID=121624 RepID=A0ABR1YJ66_9PEZI
MGNDAWRLLLWALWEPSRASRLKSNAPRLPTFRYRLLEEDEDVCRGDMHKISQPKLTQPLNHILARPSKGKLT